MSEIKSLVVDGYRMLRLPGHPRAYDNGYIAEHIVIAETALGKALPLAAVVHHVDGNRGNNAHSNLVICENDAYHQTLHKRQRVLAAGADPDTHKSCTACGTMKPFGDFYRDRSRLDGLNAACIECCKTSRRTMPRVCVVCSSVFLIVPSEAKRGGIACSVKCRNVYINSRRSK